MLPLRVTALIALASSSAGSHLYIPAGADSLTAARAQVRSELARRRQSSGPVHPPVYPTLDISISQFSGHPLCHGTREAPLSGRGWQEIRQLSRDRDLIVGIVLQSVPS